MPRGRAKLTPEQRARRAEKRERRVAEAPEREARARVRDALRTAGPTTLELIRDATWRYAAAIASGLAMLEPGYVDDRVVCERCGLVQDFRRAEDGDEVDPCESCGGLLAISIERYREETAEPLIYIYDS